MQKPKKAFRNHPQNRVSKSSNRDMFTHNISCKRNIRGECDSYHSFAPELTYIVKSTSGMNGFFAIIISFFLYLSIRNLLEFGFNYLMINVILVLLTLLVLAIFFMTKNILKKIKNKKEYKIILSKKALCFDGRSFDWSKIMDEEILIEGHGKRYKYYYLFFYSKELKGYIKFPLQDFINCINELEYLLEVYRARHDGGLIIKKDKYEKKYLDLSSKKKSNYIIS